MLNAVGRSNRRISHGIKTNLIFFGDVVHSPEPTCVLVFIKRISWVVLHLIQIAHCIIKSRKSVKTISFF